MAELNATSQAILNDNRVRPGYTVPPSTVGQYIVDAARQRNIDPNVALAVYRSEGLGNYQSQFVKNGNQERSYGPYQLYLGGGLGNQFEKDTKLNAVDPNNWKQNVDYALNYAANSPNGWKPWYGFQKTEYASQGNKAGIGQDAKTQPISPNGSAKPDGAIPGATAERQLTEDEKTLAKDPGPPRDAEGNLNKNWYQNDETGETYYNPFRAQAEADAGSNVFANIKQVPSPNPLHDYESNTYNIGLYAISTYEHTRLVNNPEVYRPGLGTLLIASGGRQVDNASNYLRNPYFTEDFFFENLRLTTTVNTTERSGNSNLVLCDFTIIEPNGFTLLDRLIDAVASPPINGQSYLHQPYVLEISFFGYKDGIPDPALRAHTKYLPIRLVDVKSRNSHKGTEYTITASAFNHQALSQVYVEVPAMFSVKAQTVGDMLGTGDISNSLIAMLDHASNRATGGREFAGKPGYDEVGNLIQPNGIPGSGDPNSQATLNLLSKTQFQVNGITNAINSWYQRMKKNGVTSVVYSKVSVELDPEIRDARLISVSPNTVQQAAPINPKNSATNTAQQAAGLNKGGISFDGTAMSVPAGTRLDKLIDFAIRSSSYIDKQLRKDPDKRTQPDNAQGNQPLKWYKIIPRIKIVDYIPESNTYSLDITYVVKKWLRTTDYPYAPIGRQLGFVKEYNYMYTGGRSPVSGEWQSNRDVLDLQIDFNILYFQPFTVFKEKDQINSTAAGIYDKNQPGYEDTGVSCAPRRENVFSAYDYGKIGRPSRKYIAKDAQLQNKNSPQSQSAVTAADLQKSLMTGSRGDMVNVKLKIIGDPTLIKQDDIFYGQTLEVVTTSDKTPNYSLWTDNGELYVFLNFRSPIDYDQTTGLANPGDNPYFSSGLWSGVYRIVTVENTFNRGKFEQTLDLVRLLIDDNTRATDFSTVGQRFNTYTNAGFPQVAAALPSRFSGPNIVKAGTAGLAAGVSSVLNAAGGGGGAGNALVSGLLGQVQSLAVGAVQNLVTKELNAVISKGVSELKSFINRPSPEALAKANAEDAARDMEVGSASETAPVEANGGESSVYRGDGQPVADESLISSVDPDISALDTDLIPAEIVVPEAGEVVEEAGEVVAEAAEAIGDAIGGIFA